MTLSPQKIRQFRTIGHSLHPIVTVAGKGLSDNVIAEIDRALEDHELIKIKLSIIDRNLRTHTAEEACKKCNAKLVQEIGKIALIFREAKKPNVKKSNIR